MMREADSSVSDLREILQHPNPPLTLRNGLWHVRDRDGLWQALGSRLFDEDLDSFRECAVSVLAERDPKFQLPPEQRYAASVYGKELKYSHELRRGLSETLALLGNRSSILVNCSTHKGESTASLAVREILEGADWVLWGSLEDLLPILAEAAPMEFMDAVDGALVRTPSPFDELFSQEGSGIMGGNYLTGLLWALETLAWDEDYLVRGCVALGRLASRDPGGNWANRPARSLTTILLPWMPQTVASFQKKSAAIHTLRREEPNVAWSTLVSLLPENTQTSTPTRQPRWRDTIPEDWQEHVSKSEYWEQVTAFADLTVDMASEDLPRLEELIPHLNDLPRPQLQRVLRHLSSEGLLTASEESILGVWTALNHLIWQHRRFSDAKWALPAEVLSEIEDVAARLAPRNPLYRNRILFQWDELDDEPGPTDVHGKKARLDERRQNAIREILSHGGMEAIIRFVDLVDSPLHVAASLAAIAGTEVDEFILPSLLTTDDKQLREFVRSYVSLRRYENGWEWVDRLDRSSWSPSHTAMFLTILPFAQETWNRVDDWLDDNESEYWVSDALNPYSSADEEMDYGIDKLMTHRRYGAAIRCLAPINQKHILDTSRMTTALISAAIRPGSIDSLDPYLVGMLIKALQADPTTNSDDLVRIEWDYLSLLDEQQGILPRTLESRLASDPDTFCQLIRLLYRSRKEEASRSRDGERDEAVAANAWSLLHRWRVPPGTQDEGEFSTAHFESWLSRVRDICEESGHLEVAYSHIGQVLISCPADPDGLWIHHSAADALNEEGANEMRSGYSMGIRNSRGAHIIDPTGQPERELAKQYREKASEIENAGYYRFAAELSRLADSYDREADQIIDDHVSET